MSMKGRDSVKVTVIETQYVQTDAMNFKAVVQKLTGKDDQVTVTAPERKPAGVAEKRHVAEETGVAEKRHVAEETGVAEYEYFQKMLRVLLDMDDL